MQHRLQQKAGKYVGLPVGSDIGRTEFLRKKRGELANRVAVRLL